MTEYQLPDRVTSFSVGDEVRIVGPGDLGKIVSLTSSAEVEFPDGKIVKFGLHSLELRIPQVPANQLTYLDRISSFTYDNGFLSNFHPCEIWYDGLYYPSTEHAFQAAKTLDTTLRQMIQGATTPGKAKRMGGPKGIIPPELFRPDWDEIKVDVMRELLVLKFSQGFFMQKLLATGNAMLVEGNDWHDTFWGVTNHNGVGSNILGHLLMSIRQELQQLTALGTKYYVKMVPVS